MHLMRVLERPWLPDEEVSTEIEQPDPARAKLLPKIARMPWPRSKREVMRIDGPEAPLAAKLDHLTEERWDELHRKMKALADAGGWRP
jgi:hypothetical protein